MPEQLIGTFTVVGPVVDTGLRIGPRESIRVAATGVVNFGGIFPAICSPDGQDAISERRGWTVSPQQLRKYSLVVKIGNTWEQAAAGTRELSSFAGGSVLLAANDDLLSDNTGGWQVTITHVTPVLPQAALQCYESRGGIGELGAISYHGRWLGPMPIPSAGAGELLGYHELYRVECLTKTLIASDRTPCCLIYGAIREKWWTPEPGNRWFATGLPVADEEDTVDRRGRQSRTEFGSVVYRYGAAEAYRVYGAIFAKWRQLGGETGICGYPTSDEMPAEPPGGRLSDFEGASIGWTQATGACEIHGLIRAKWNTALPI